jgi:hypothetical protein
MKRLQGILGWIAPLVILGAAIAVFLLMGSQPPPQRVDADAPAAVPVRTAVVAAHEGGIDIESDGVVVPLREVTLAAEVSGRVLEKSSACRSGQYVTKGTVLFRIDPRDYELDVARLERELQQAVLTIDEIDEELTQNAESVELSKRQLEIAKREANRLDTLAQGRIVTESAADQAARDELTTTNTLSNLQGQRRVLQKRRNRLEDQGTGGRGRRRRLGRAGVVCLEGDDARHARGYECRRGEDEFENGRGGEDLGGTVGGRGGDSGGLRDPRDVGFRGVHPRRSQLFVVGATRSPGGAWSRREDKDASLQGARSGSDGREGCRCLRRFHAAVAS